MKKLVLMASVFAIAITANAQNAIEESKLTDNISITLKGGGATPLNNAAFWGDMRGVLGLELRKQITPTFGLGIEGEWSMNTSSWMHQKNSNFFEHQLLGTFGSLNFMNMIGGYNGMPRTFEIEAVAGVGWLHYYSPVYDSNSWYTKTGLNFNFNIGDEKEWTLSFMPAVVWNMGGKTHYGDLGYSSQFSKSQAALQMLVGVSYHFPNSNGTHSFALVEPYDQMEVDYLNEQINELRADLDIALLANAALEMTADELAIKLDECQNSEPKVVKEVNTKQNSVRYIFFRQGSAKVTADQQPNVEMIASFLKKHKDATVVIKGYASPEGPIDVNTRLANERANVVKNILVSKYGIAASRITAEGQGIGDMFTEDSWNRVSICTIIEK